MKILVIGSGGREHAIVWKLAQSPRVKQIVCAPGNAGTAKLARNLEVHSDQPAALLELARREGVDWTVVGPEVPLAAGVADVFRAAGMRIFGPTQLAAQLESSKAFAKQFMQRHAVPTARYGEFTDRDAAIRHIETCGYDVVVKADGLAAGKGVVVPDTPEQAISAVRMMMDEGAFGGAGARVVLEEKLTGEEATLLCFCDGRTLLPMVPSQDHKRVNDDDKGPNTGGMGVYAPAPLITPELMEKIKHKVLEPTLKGLIEDQLDYRGVLYVGLMIVDGEPYVIEYNARFGDPETEVVLPLMETDLVDVLEAVEAQTLERLALSWKTGAAVSVVLASGGYPGKYETGHHIRGLDQTGDALVFHAGTAEKGGKVVTAGGRVLAVTALGDTLQQAIDYAYLAVDKIDFQDKHYRTDIGKKGLKATDT